MATSSHQDSCPEKRLLVCCARTRIEPPLIDEIRKLAGEPLDWDFLLAQASDHSVTPLLCRQLYAAAADLLAPVPIARLQKRMQEQAVRSLILARELIAILGRFQSQGIQAMPYKGSVLAAQAYGDLALREFGDVDILLRHRDIAKANDILIAAGYRPKFPWNLSMGAAASPFLGEYAYRDASRRILVELHTERTLRHFPEPPNLEDLATRLVSVSLGGHQVLTFAPEDNLLLLCVHGCKDFWGQLVWIVDVAELVRAYPGLDWDRCLQLANALRADRMLLVGLALALGFFGAPLPGEIASRVHADSTAKRMASHVERSFFAREWREPGAAARFNFRRRLLHGPFAGWRYSLRLTTAPSDDDWSAIDLPPGLAPLYFALRPLRLLRKYGVTGR